MLLVIIWILEIVVCLFLAKLKNRSLGWSIIAGSLFGIVAILFYLLCSKLANCPKCGGGIKTDSRICPHCGEKI